MATKKINRRHFLAKSAGLLACGLFGESSLNAVQASTQKPRMAIIIDDIGYSHHRAYRFLNIGIPLTFSVLPRLPRSSKLAMLIHNRGHEVMLHQPMEPTNGKLDPGPGALYTGDSAERIDKILSRNMLEIPYAKGINNHMGSKFTRAQRETKKMLQVVRSRGLFFVDSLTCCRSLGYPTARELHMYAAPRDLFLDNTLSTQKIVAQLLHLKALALKNGKAIGIGHPHNATADALKLFAKQKHDICFSYASAIL